MNKIYRIFISSTFIDLKEERKVIIKSILRMHHFPVCMELFGAYSEKQSEVIRNAIDISDYYVLIIKRRYGSIEPTSGKCYIELEFDYAVSKGLPVFAFIFDEDSYQNANKVDRSRELENFKCKVIDKITVAWWSNRADLISQLTASLYNELRHKEFATVMNSLIKKNLVNNKIKCA